MITSYTYQITNVNSSLGAMEITFSASGYPDVLVGARIPYEDENLETLVASFAPTAHWENLNRQVASIQVGRSGAIDATAVVPGDFTQPVIPQFTPGQTSLTSAKTTPLQFLSLFTPEEQLAVTTASLQAPQIRLWYDQLIAATEVVNTDPRIAAGLDALVAFGLLTQARRNVILPPA